MDGLIPPPPFHLEGNLAEKWKMWKQDFTIFLQTTESTTKSDLVKSLILLHCIGKQAKEIYKTFTVATVDDKVKYAEIIKKFDEHFSLKKNLTFLHFTFLIARQVEGETFDEYVTRLKTLSEDCEFGELRNSLIKDLIIIGLGEKKLQERLLSEPAINLEQVCKRGQANEVTKQQARTIQATSRETSSINQLSNQNRSNIRKDLINYCKFCSGTHNRGNCPAWGQLCNIFQKHGHFAKCCSYRQKPKQAGVKSSKQSRHPSVKQQVNQLETGQIHLQALILNSFREPSFMKTQMKNQCQA